MTAWEVYGYGLSGEPRGYVDVDQVGMCFPDPGGDPGRYALKARAAAAVVRRFPSAGTRTVVVSGVLNEESLARIVEALDPVGVTFCRLRVDTEELRRRLQRRYGPDDMARALTEAAEWDRYGDTHLVVDTGEGDPGQAARRVVAAVRRAAPAARAAAAAPSVTRQAATRSNPLSPGGGRVVLICGPAAVGKSTVGSGLFQSLPKDGRAAYLDLQQLAFLSDVPDRAPSRHQVVAGAVADLWRQYRSVGAQDLVLTGQVEHQDDVQSYRDALGGDPLLVCRLQADAQSLRERSLARARGGGPALAGDALVGLSAGEAETVLHRALAQQSRLQEAELSDFVLDTAGQSADTSTQQLAAQWGVSR